MISQHADDVIVLWITYSVNIDRQAVQRHCWLYVFIRCVGGCSPYLTQELLGVLIIRHSRLPAGNALWFCQNFEQHKFPLGSNVESAIAIKGTQEFLHLVKPSEWSKSESDTK